MKTHKWGTLLFLCGLFAGVLGMSGCQNGGMGSLMSNPLKPVPQQWEPEIVEGSPSEKS